jgi:hypothetical protein
MPATGVDAVLGFAIGCLAIGATRARRERFGVLFQG